MKAQESAWVFGGFHSGVSPSIPQHTEEPLNIEAKMIFCV
jgi:hypothetical protein